MDQFKQICEGITSYNLAFVMKDPQEFVTILQETYKFKVKGTGPLEFHLGADFCPNPDGTLCMAPPKKYVERLAIVFEQMIGEKPKSNYTFS